MKFTDGYWLKKKGVNIYNAAEVYDVKRDNDSVTVYCPPVKVMHRGQTLGGPLLTIRFTSPRENIIRVQAYHFTGGAKKEPSFEIADETYPIDVAETDDEITLSSGKLRVKVYKKDFKIEYLYDGRLLTSTGNKQLGYITAPDGVYMREQLALDIGEAVYGLGERFTPFVKNGQVVDIWNEDGGTASEQAYKNIPFYITNKGYGVFVNDTGRVSYEIASEVVSRVQFSVPGEKLDYMVIGGDDLKGVLENYTALTGRPALPPAWSFGLWLSTSFTTDYDEKTVNSFIDGMTQRGIPLSVFHFDCFWMKEYEWCNFGWDERQFPDPAGMLARLKEKGLRICVWINPYIAQKSPLFEEGKENGYLLKRPNGDVWQWDMWQPGMGLVDFTNPAACEWYCSKLQRLMDMGVDCFKTDFGERIPTDVVYFDGSDPVKMHNYYTYLYNKTVFELIKKNKGENNALVFARSATAGSQKFPVHWGGDCDSEYYSMAESLRGGLSLAMSGFGFWSHDISGFESTATPDLYKRWAAFGLLSTHSRLHGSGSYRVPWLFDEEAVEVVRYFTELKCSLMPYLYSMACITAQRGIPSMRSMVLEFPEDANCAWLDRQYMLGDSLLIAPIFCDDSTVDYYLPDGYWTNFISNKVVEGGRWQHEKHSYLSLPLMVRPNSIIPVGSNNQTTDYAYGNGLTLHVFELEDGKAAQTTVYDRDGSLIMEATVLKDGDTVRMHFNGKVNGLSVLLRNVFAVTQADGAKIKATDMGVELLVDDKLEDVTCVLG
ncbi:alpha-xylosidase [Mahella sp.]|uniref:alpha-xylosidase n=1 Tax=Mahella sp. TaxID=2798721 RepID=UPI0025C59CB3|nr:alpha-xylosidase [Mahella sp.]MBZ4665440.1 glycoside hydrolase family 31 [Mahella sp.]